MICFPVLLLPPLLLPLLTLATSTSPPPPTSSYYLGHYLVLNGTVTDTPATGHGPPESRPYETSSSQNSQRAITLNVSGTNPGALPVLCELPPWQPESRPASPLGVNTTSTQPERAIDFRFNCTDPGVSAQLQALTHLDYNWGFYVVVALK